MESLAESLGLHIDRDNKDRPLTADSLEGLPFDEICRRILQSPEYRYSILARVQTGSLPPAVEIRLIDAAYGKAPDKLKIETKKPVAECSDEELADELESYVDEMRRRKAKVHAIDIPTSNTTH